MFVFYKTFSWVIDREIKRLKFIGYIMRNNNKGTIDYTTKFGHFFVVLPLKGVHYNKTHLLIWVAFGFSNIFEMRKNDLVKKAERFFSVRPVFFRKCGIKTGLKSILK